MPIWFLGSSIFVVVHCADLVPKFFCIYSRTLRQYSYTSTIPGQDAPRPLPSPARVLSFFLSVGNVSQRERISARARTPSGDTTKIPEGGWKAGRQRELASIRAGTPSGDTTRTP